MNVRRVVEQLKHWLVDEVISEIVRSEGEASLDWI